MILTLMHLCEEEIAPCTGKLQQGDIVERDHVWPEMALVVCDSKGFESFPFSARRRQPVDSTRRNTKLQDQASVGIDTNLIVGSLFFSFSFGRT